MGYLSDYNGSITFCRKMTNGEVEKIKGWFIERFGEYTIEDDGTFKFDTICDSGTHWYSGDIVFRTDEQSVVPSAEHMKGYNFNEHLYEFTEWMKREMSVAFDGYFERIGEEFGDLEAIRVCDGVVKSYHGCVAWDNPVVCDRTEAQKNARFESLFNKTSGFVIPL